MSDKSTGLGKLLAKSKSTIRRARRGSVDGSNSIDSDDATTSSQSFPRGRSSVSHVSQSVLDSDSADKGPIIIRVGDEKEEDSTTSLVSSGYDSEDAELL